MFLKKLEISGFKSFAARTALDFGCGGGNEKKRGISVIVGPNGSGKSNIADAMRWVMGEQSMKNLRGKKSEDIIFAGSSKKARLGSAGVTLYLDNSDRKIPLEFQEVTIARKIFRSGESEYLINGSKVRLQDVVDILAKTGIGRESYAVINQGMADSVLNASPTERRIVIEDAAGVKQYQIKKERSIRKLESTRQNLTRVYGLTEEIKPHLKMLKRQAQRASQSETVARELAEKQTKLFSFLWRNFQEEKNRLIEEKEDAGRLMMNVQREADKLSDELGISSREEKTDNRQTELENSQREERNKLSELERDLIVTEGRIELEKEKEKNSRMLEEIKIKNAPADSPLDLNYVKISIEEIRKEQEKLIIRIEQAEKMEDLQDIKEFARVIQQKLYTLKSDIEKGKKSALPAGGEEKIENNPEKNIKPMENNSEIIIQMWEKVLKIREEIKISEKKIEKITQEIQKETEKNREQRIKFFEVEKKLRARQEELNKLKDLFNEAKIALAKVEVREDDLKNQVKNELKKDANELNPTSEEIDCQKFESEIHKLKIKMEQIGGIDPMVIEEYNETDKRFNFLTGEAEDLEKAIVSLKEVVKEMDQKIAEKFNETYEEINKEFSKYFKIIFGGGQAHLRKFQIPNPKSQIKEEESEKENENIGDAELNTSVQKENEQVGIDISACPPGKRISNLNMLSGGERSLTSLALLFAIISHNPPPFSILDEVEAALDEANSKRFGRILTELSNHTQFVIITHNRETMRQASLLYGVTMGEDGISKLLSVRLDQVGAGGKIKE